MHSISRTPVYPDLGESLKTFQILNLSLCQSGNVKARTSLSCVDRKVRRWTSFDVVLASLKLYDQSVDVSLHSLTELQIQLHIMTTYKMTNRVFIILSVTTLCVCVCITYCTSYSARMWSCLLLFLLPNPCAVNMHILAWNWKCL